MKNKIINPKTNRLVNIDGKIGKAILKQKGAARKKRYDYSNDFQNLINTISDRYILLEFIPFLNKDYVNNVVINNVYIVDGMPTKGRQKRFIMKNGKCTIGNLNYTGILFHGKTSGHWIGYVDGKETFNSYGNADKSCCKVQIKGTNNYCQSFASFLFSNKGDLKIKSLNASLKKLKNDNDYETATHNVQEISKLWLKFFKEMEKDTNTNKWLKKTINEASNDKNTKKKFTLKDLKKTLAIIIKNKNVAEEFATSK